MSDPFNRKTAEGRSGSIAVPAPEAPGVSHSAMPAFTHTYFAELRFALTRAVIDRKSVV